MYFERLRNLREYHGKTQEQISKLLNCNRNAYGRYERGEREIPVCMIIQLAKYYRCTTDYILGLSDEKGSFMPDKTLRKNQARRMSAYHDAAARAILKQDGEK